MIRLSTPMKVGILVLVIIASWAYFFFAFSSQSYKLDTKDPAILAAVKWLQLADEEKWEDMLPLTGTEDPGKFLDVFKEDRKLLGKIKKRELRRKSSYSTKGGQLAVVEFLVDVEGQRRRIPEKIFVTLNNTDSANPEKVTLARYVVSIPRMWKNGMNYYGNSSPGTDDPVSVATKWFRDFDSGSLEDCAGLPFIRRSYDQGKFFFDPTQKLVDKRFLGQLKNYKKVGDAISRTTISKEHWKGIPGASQMEIVMVVSKAKYKDGTRIERIWTFKDPQIPQSRWLPFEVHFSKLQKNAAPKAASKKDKKSK